MVLIAFDVHGLSTPLSTSISTKSEELNEELKGGKKAFAGQCGVLRGQVDRLIVSPIFFVNEQQIPRWLNLSQLLIG